MVKGRLTRVAFVAACSLTLLAAAPNDLLLTSDSPVADAVMQGERDIVREFLRQGVDVNAAQGDGMTALHWAAVKEDVETAKMLLYAGANVKATTRLGAFTPIFLAAKTGNPAMLETLVDASSDVNVATSMGVTPLMMVAASGNLDAVNLLLDRGADINAEEMKGRTPLMFAAAYNRADVIDVLANQGAEISATSEVVDVGSEAKKWTEEVFGKLRREREAAAKKAKEEAAKKAAAEGAPPPTAEAREGGEKKAEGGSMFGKLFGWLPGVGNEKAQENEQRRRRFFRESFGQLVGKQGGVTALHLAARDGHQEAVEALLAAGAGVNELSTGDKTSPLLIATVNGHFDAAAYLLDQGGDPNLASEANGATPLYAAINLQWGPKSLYPQPQAYHQQKLSYLDFMELLLERGADPNARLTKKVWYSGFNFDLSGVNEQGATPFWRAAYGADVEAMKLLVAYGADPNIRTTKPKERPSVGGETRDVKDLSGLPPVPNGGPAVTPLQAAAGVGYGEGFAANSHRFHPAGQLKAVIYLVEELGADVNARDHEGYAAIHHAAARGDNAMIDYLVSKGADVMVVSREGQTTVDMANGPVQRIQPFPETVALLEGMGALNNNNCVSC